MSGGAFAPSAFAFTGFDVEATTPVATKRMAVLQVVHDRMLVISQASGYATDAGEAVYYGEVELGDTDPDTAITIMPGAATETWQGESMFVTWPIEIQALAKAGIENAWLTVEALIGDIKRAFELKGAADPNRNLNGLCNHVVRRGGVRVLERAPGSQTVGCGVIYAPAFVENWGQP